MTEDLLEEQSEVLAKLGTSAEGAHLRARMQSACLLSDMESFKVALLGHWGEIRVIASSLNCPSCLCCTVLKVSSFFFFHKMVFNWFQVERKTYWENS